MSDFEIWFITGLRHILDINGYDHILFVALLTVSFPIKEWKKLLGFVTAFTIGHSLTLALSVLEIIRFKREYCELFIAITILITAFSIFLSKQNHPNRVMYLYGIICCFGLIHGMGFSFILKSMLTQNESIVKPLFLFNLGLEAGQIIIIVIITLISLFLIRSFKIQFNIIQKSLAVSVGFVSFSMCIQRMIYIYNL